jgi:hypothetical protein
VLFSFLHHLYQKKGKRKKGGKSLPFEDMPQKYINKHLAPLSFPSTPPLNVPITTL